MKRVLVIQPTLPSYRIDFFERLAAHLEAEGGALWVHYAARDYLGVRAAAKMPEKLRLSEKVYHFNDLLKKTPLSSPLAPYTALRWAEVVILPGHIHELEVLLSAIWGKLSGKRLIWWGSFPQEGRTKRRVRLWAASRCDAVATYMPSQWAALPETLRGRARSLNNGLKPLQKPPHRPKLSERPRAIAVIGRPSKKSGIIPWIRALCTRWRGGALTVHLLGTAEEDLSELQPLVLPEGVEVHAHGYVEGEAALLSILAGCRLCFYPGAIGLSLMEATRAGIPTLIAAPPAPHMPEVEAFEEGVSGRYFEAEDYPAASPSLPPWPEALEAALEDEVWLDQAQVGCLERGLTFSTEVMAKQMFELISGPR